jgi:Transposase IS116/IS110/IS902 family
MTAVRSSGIGPVLGAVIVAGIGEVTRFGHPGRLCSWAGLTPRGTGSPVPKSAAGTSPGKGRGTCAGHWPGPSSTCPLATCCASAREDILARRGKEAKNITKIAMARPLLTWACYAMRDGQV